MRIQQTFMRAMVIDHRHPFPDYVLQLVEVEEGLRLGRQTPRMDIRTLYPGSACSRSSRRVRKNRSTGPLSRPVRSRAG